MANQPIPVEQADEMMAQYLDYMTKLGVDMQKQTHSISFTSKELLQWLGESMPFADELRVCLGVYPEGAENPGRITSILWPYKYGRPATWPKTEGKDSDDDPDEIPPYNGGTLNP